MKLAILISASLRVKLFTENVLSQIRSQGELVMNEGEDCSEEHSKQLMKDADVVITSWGSVRLTADILDEAPNLKLVVHAAGSVKGVVSDELFARGIRVVSCARVLSEGVSEMALGMTIAATKDIFRQNTLIHSGGWGEDKSLVNEVYEMTIGIIGFGFAGRHYAELLRAFGVTVLVYDPYCQEELINTYRAEKVDLDELLERSDIISLHAADIPETRHIINATSLAKMKDSAILINTARGALIDEAALETALEAGKFKYVCLDVTDPEPPTADHPLKRFERVIFTPHIAGLVSNGQLKIGAMSCSEIKSFNTDGTLSAEVTEEQLARMA